jgi:hypothetical protein
LPSFLRKGIHPNRLAVIPAKAGIHPNRLAVIPAKAGIHPNRGQSRLAGWIPAFAGMTGEQLLILGMEILW